jgi:hypothetical protein
VQWEKSGEHLGMEGDLFGNLELSVRFQFGERDNMWRPDKTQKGVAAVRAYYAFQLGKVPLLARIAAEELQQTYVSIVVKRHRPIYADKVPTDTGILHIPRPADVRGIIKSLADFRDSFFPYECAVAEGLQAIEELSKALNHGQEDLIGTLRSALEQEHNRCVNILNLLYCKLNGKDAITSALWYNDALSSLVDVYTSIWSCYLESWTTQLRSAERLEANNAAPAQELPTTVEKHFTDAVATFCNGLPDSYRLACELGDGVGFLACGYLQERIRVQTIFSKAQRAIPCLGDIRFNVSEAAFKSQNARVGPGSRNNVSYLDWVQDEAARFEAEIIDRLQHADASGSLLDGGKLEHGQLISSGDAGEDKLLDQPKPNLATEQAPPFDHDEHFEWVRFDGEEHDFFENQAECVKVLWIQSQKGRHILHQKEITKNIDNKRLRDVFKGHRAWMTMIVYAKDDAGNDIRGKFKLRVPVPRDARNTSTS